MNISRIATRQLALPALLGAGLLVPQLVAAKAYGGSSLSDTSQGTVTAQQATASATLYTAAPAQCLSRDFAYSVEGLAELRAALNGWSSSVCASYCQEMAPTLEQCTSPEWMNSVCGRLEAALINRTAGPLGMDLPHPSRCIQAIADDIAAGSWPVDLEQLQVVATATRVLQPDGSVVEQPAPGARRQATFVPFERGGLAFGGLATTWYGYHMAAFTELSKLVPSVTFVDQRATERAEWDANGYAIDSCREYTYEKYYDYSLFEDMSAPLGNDYRAVFDLAYTPGGGATPAPRWALGTHGLAGDPISQKNGTPLYQQIQFPAGVQPKNTYFSFAPFASQSDFHGGELTRAELIAQWQQHPDDYPGGRPLAGNIVILDDQLDAILKQGRLSHGHLETWAWHQQQSQALAGFLDEELYAMEQFKEEFEVLLLRRTQILEAIHEYWRRIFEEQLHELPVVVENPVFDRDALINPARDPISALISAQQEQQEQVFQVQTGIVEQFDAFTVHGMDFDVPETSVMSGTLPSGQTPMMGPLTTWAQLGMARFVGQSGGAGVVRSPGLSADQSALGQLPYDDCALFDDFLLLATCQLAHAEAAIEEALLFARDLGCLDLSGANPCDWSPKLFYQRVQDPYGVYREPDYDACNNHSKNGFGMLRDWGAFLVNQQPVVLAEFHGQQGVSCDNQDWGASPDQVEKYIACYDAWVAETIAALQQALKGAGTVYGYGSFGKSYGDDLSVGGDMFGAGLSFATAWSVGNLTTSTSSNYCDMRPDFAGDFSAAARALYMELPLISAHGEYQLRQGGHASARIEIRDQAVVDAWGALSPETFNIVEASDAVDQTLFRAGATFFVVIVPVTIAGGAAGQVGAAVSVGGGLPAAAGPAGCAGGNMATLGAFRPFAAVNAFASASVDAVIVEAGVKARLTLLSVELPLTTELRFTDNPQNIDATMDLSTNLDLVLSVLSGSLRAFVEICYVFDCDSYEKSIFSWDGPHYRRNLYGNHVNVSVLPLLGWLEGQP